MQIGEFSHKVGLSVDTLRYYEKNGLVPKPDRTNSGRRRYSDDDVSWMEFLKVLRATGMKIKEMQRYLYLRSQGEQSIAARRQMLCTHLQHVSKQRKRLQETEALLKSKISLFQSVLDGETEAEHLTCSKEPQS